MKTCSKCGFIGDNGLFVNDKNLCKKCLAEYRKKHRAKNKEKMSAYYDENKEKIAARQKEYKAKNKEKISDSYVKRLLAKHCGLNSNDIPQQLIALKREQIKLDRLIKDGL